MAIIISDVRYPNEAAAIQKQPNGIVICFDASDETLNNVVSAPVSPRYFGSELSNDLKRMSTTPLLVMYGMLNLPLYCS